MKASLILRNFKRIRDHIELHDMTRVNYFVGENGSGKSSVLNALSYLNDPINSRHFFSANSILEFRTSNGESHNRYLQWSDDIANNVSSNGNLRVELFTMDVENSEMGANAIQKIRFHYSVGKPELQFLNETSKMLGFRPIQAKLIMETSDPWDEKAGKRIFLEEEGEVNTHFVAHGIKAFNGLRNVLSNATKFVLDRSPQAAIVLIEEPENHLHPSFQKLVPKIFDEFLNSLGEAVSSVFVCVSTHSPFIISASSQFEYSKVFMLKSGHLLDLNMNQVSETSGFSSSQCAGVVAQMLGSDITDLGYPENYCILEEYSLQLILSSAQAKGLTRRYQFVSASGISRVISLANTYGELANLNTLVKCNPYYSDRYKMIVDNLAGIESAVKDRFESIRAKLGDRFIELSKHSVEEYYSNLSGELHDAAIREIAGAKGVEIGLIKAKYAVKIAELIDSKDSFSKLFDGELDFLLP